MTKNEERAAGIQQFLTRRQACELLGIGMRTLDSFREKGQLVCYKLGGRTLYAKSDLLALIRKENNHEK